jgi:hypothetical protein
MERNTQYDISKHLFTRSLYISHRKPKKKNRLSSPAIDIETAIFRPSNGYAMGLESFCLPDQDPQTQSGQSLRYRRTFVLFSWPEAPGRSLRPSPHHSAFFSSLAIPDFLYLLYPSSFFLISPPPRIITSFTMSSYALSESHKDVSALSGPPHIARSHH